MIKIKACNWKVTRNSFLLGAVLGLIVFLPAFLRGNEQLLSYYGSMAGSFIGLAVALYIVKIEFNNSRQLLFSEFHNSVKLEKRRALLEDISVLEHCESLIREGAEFFLFVTGCFGSEEGKEILPAGSYDLSDYFMQNSEKLLNAYNQVVEGKFPWRLPVPEDIAHLRVVNNTTLQMEISKQLHDIQCIGGLFNPTLGTKQDIMLVVTAAFWLNYALKEKKHATLIELAVKVENAKKGAKAELQAIEETAIP